MLGKVSNVGYIQKGIIISLHLQYTKNAKHNAMSPYSPIPLAEVRSIISHVCTVKSQSQNSKQYLWFETFSTFSIGAWSTFTVETTSLCNEIRNVALIAGINRGAYCMPTHTILTCNIAANH